MALVKDLKGLVDTELIAGILRIIDLALVSLAGIALVAPLGFEPGKGPFSFNRLGCV